MISINYQRGTATIEGGDKTFEVRVRADGRVVIPDFRIETADRVAEALTSLRLEWLRKRRERAMPLVEEATK